MTVYVMQRIGQAIVTMLGVIFVVVLLENLSGDPASLMVSPDAPHAEETIASIRHELGYDRPVYVQFVRLLGRVARGDFGESVRERRPALEVVAARLPATLELVALALAVSAVVGIPIGVVGAVRHRRLTDRLTLMASLVGLTLPSFWLGILLILFFAQELRWLPAFGGGTAQQLILPVATLAPYSTALIARITRSSLLDVLSRDYIRTARAKGLTSAVVLTQHALRNAALPILTIIGLRAGILSSASVIVEMVFAYPGSGQLVLDAVQWRDLPLVVSVITIYAGIIISVNIVTDLMYAYLNPAVRLA